MACGDCGEDRAGCRCVIEAADDGSVSITGTGEPGDPYIISAPGAGAGTRTYDRAAIYYESGSYSALPGSYPHFDFYGPTDPDLISGFTPSNFDGWYQFASNAPIALKEVSIAAESGSATTLGVTLPADLQDGQFAVVSVLSAGGAATTPSGWDLTATVPVSGAVLKIFTRKVGVAQRGSNHVFGSIISPTSVLLEIYSGTAGVAAVTPVTAVATGTTALTLGSITPLVPGSLLLGIAGIDSQTNQLMKPTAMAAINATTGTGRRQLVTSQLLDDVNPSGSRQFTTNIPSNFAGALLLLHPATTVIYRIWLDGAWQTVQVIDPGGSLDTHIAVIGDGVSSTFTVVHPLGTQDVRVDVVRSDNRQDSFPVVQRPTSDTVYLDFSSTIPAVGAYRVLISKVG